MITVDWSNGKPVEFLDFTFRPPNLELNWKDQVGIFPHKAVADWNVGKYKEKRKALLFLYDEMFNKLTSCTNFTQEWNDQFQQLLEVMIEPELIPYYQALSPKFFNRFITT